MKNIEVYDIVFVIFKNNDYVEKMKHIFNFCNVKKYRFIKQMLDYDFDDDASKKDKIIKKSFFSNVDKINYFTNYYIWTLVSNHYNNCLIIYEDEKYINNETLLKFLVKPRIFFWNIIIYVDNFDIYCYAMTSFIAKELLKTGKPMSKKINDFLIDAISSKKMKHSYYCENYKYEQIF
jgi:hypothetical protein